MRSQINLNCDMGESYGRWTLGDDGPLMELVPTVNIACGFHAGDPHVMRHTVELAAGAGVEIGAHVALPDVLGFGRRRMAITADELGDYVLYQVGALRAFVEAAGLRLGHVKPHGALFAMCGESGEYALALLGAMRALDPTLVAIVGGPAVPAAAAATGMRAVPEGYVDLAYQPNGFPVIERAKRAWDPAEVADRALRIVRERRLPAADGSTLSLDVPTICVHGDAPNALEVARAIRARLAAEGIAVVPLTRMLTREE
ncbi:MAG: 5-oxoprolinase subunit PxpA [Candidatus Rokubacteria bacterium]|nr:5-oxoprolinase subunit PxpA [Candidatus Rokubacteria bacterium]